ncbi:MAG TPA: acyl-CoA dehydrogenase family protein [Mycobacteriales bacterium]|nr:acyl-CoA dehydrogenase family protein [Mycobacteriales bacterium]
MHFLPTDEQRELQRGVRELLDARFPLEKLPVGFDEAVWQALAETGLFALRTELDLGLADAVLVVEEIGRACLPGPLVGTMLAAGLATASPGAGPVTVVDTADSPLLASHLDVAASVLVLDGDTARLCPASAVAGTPVTEPVDPLTPLHELGELPAADTIAKGSDVAGLRRDGTVLTAALQVGIAARLTELAVGYAKQREQFGRTIGSFQAVKHLCADMFVRTELARVAVHAAAVTCDDEAAGDAGVDDAARAVAGAKLLADEAATVNGRSSVQVHGGMGFTWEVPVHYFLKRAWVHATEFGTVDEHAEALAELV